jgi:hypothetical protein
MRQMRMWHVQGHCKLIEHLRDCCAAASAGGAPPLAFLSVAASVPTLVSDPEPVWLLLSHEIDAPMWHVQGHCKLIEH